MIAVGVVQAPVNQVINVVPMRNCLMTTARAMPMRLIVSRSTMLGVAPIGVGDTNFNDVFISAPVFNVLQMAVVEIINVILVLNGNMSAPRTVQMCLIGGGHGTFPYLDCRMCRRCCIIGSDSDLIEDFVPRLSRHLDALRDPRFYGTQITAQSLLLFCATCDLMNACDRLPSVLANCTTIMPGSDLRDRYWTR